MLIAPLFKSAAQGMLPAAALLLCCFVSLGCGESLTASGGPTPGPTIGPAISPASGLTAVLSASSPSSELAFVSDVNAGVVVDVTLYLPQRVLTWKRATGNVAWFVEPCGYDPIAVLHATQDKAGLPRTPVQERNEVDASLRGPACPSIIPGGGVPFGTPTAYGG